MSDQRDRILATMRQVLRQTTLRPLLKPFNKTPSDVSPTEADALLEAYEPAIDRDLVMLEEAALQLAATAQRPEREPAEIDTAEFDTE